MLIVLSSFQIYMLYILFHHRSSLDPNQFGTAFIETIYYLSMYNSAVKLGTALIEKMFCLGMYKLAVKLGTAYIEKMFCLTMYIDGHPRLIPIRSSISITRGSNRL